MLQELKKQLWDKIDEIHQPKSYSKKLVAKFYPDMDEFEKTKFALGIEEKIKEYKQNVNAIVSEISKIDDYYFSASYDEKIDIKRDAIIDISGIDPYEDEDIYMAYLGSLEIYFGGDEIDEDEIDEDEIGEDKIAENNQAIESIIRAL